MYILIEIFDSIYSAKAVAAASSSIRLPKEVDEKATSSVSRSVPTPVCVTPVKEETKPIATTPKLRSKRTVNQTNETEKPHDEYSAEADDEMEEEIKLCNKKKLMVALKDINADKKLVEGSSVKTYSLEHRDKAVSSVAVAIAIPVANHSSSPSKIDTNSIPIEQPAEKVAPPVAEISDKSMSDRHSVAVAKKTKKQKIIDNDVVNVEFGTNEEHKREEFKQTAERTEELKSIETNETTKSDEIDTKSITLNEMPPVESVGSPKRDDDAGSANELGSDDMEICDDTANTTNAYEPSKFSLSKCAYTKLENMNPDANPSTNPDPQPTLKENHLVDNNKEVPTNSRKLSGSEVHQPSTFATVSPTKPHEKWTNDSLRNETSTPEEIKNIAVKTNENVDEQLPVKSSVSNISPSKLHENVVTSANNELRPNVIVDAQSEIKESPHVSPVKTDQHTDVNEQEQKDKQISPVKVSPSIANPKTSPSVRPLNDPKNEVSEKEPSPSKHISKAKTSDVDSENDKSRPPINRPEHVSPREKQQSPTKPQTSPEKSRESINSVIKSVIESNPSSSDCVPLSGSTIDVSKNDETKTTTQDFCQRIDPNKTPQCADSKLDKSETKVETKHELFKMDHSSPPSTSAPVMSVEKSHRVPDAVKTPPKEAIIQPKEEPNRAEPSSTPTLNATNGNQPMEMTKNRYKQQQTHSTKQGHSANKLQNAEHSKKNMSTGCSQTSHFDIKREAKPEIKSNSGYTNESSAMRRESPTKRDSTKQSTGYSSLSSKNYTNETAIMNNSKSSMSSGSSSTQSGSEKKHGGADKKSTSSEKKSSSAEKKPTEMRGNIDADLNKMRPQFTMNQLPNYHHTAPHQYYNLSPWDPYNYHSGYNLSHLDPSGTQKSPTKFHKDLANSMYGGMPTNYLAANSLAAQQSQQQQVRF